MRAFILGAVACLEIVSGCPLVILQRFAACSFSALDCLYNSSGCPLVDSERYKTLVDITRLPHNVIFVRFAIYAHCSVRQTQCIQIAAATIWSHGGS